MPCGRPPWAFVYLREAIKGISAFLKVKLNFRDHSSLAFLNLSFSSTRTVPAGLSKSTSWCEDGVETDQIYHGQYLDLTDPEQVRQHAMEVMNPCFVLAILENGGIKPMIRKQMQTPSTHAGEKT